jgi:hypothetical protein
MGALAALPVVGAMTDGVGIVASGGAGAGVSGLAITGKTGVASTGMLGGLTGAGDGGRVPLAGITGNIAGAVPALDESTLGIEGRTGVAGGGMTGVTTGAEAVGISGGEPFIGSLLVHWPAMAARPPSETASTPAIIFQWVRIME